MSFDGTFNNISIISWWSVLLELETRVPGENHRPAEVIDKLYHIMLYRLLLVVFLSYTEINSFMLDKFNDSFGKCSCKSNYHTIMSILADFTCLEMK